MGAHSKYVQTEDDLQQIKELGAYFKRMREESGLTQREMAEILGTRQARVSGFERGEADFYFSTLQNWAQAFGLRLEFYAVPIETEVDAEWEAAFKDALISEGN